MTLSERIKEVRTSSGDTQTKFAEKLSISRSAVSKIESGENTPSRQTIALICKIYNINYQWLVNGNGEMLKEDNRSMKMHERIKKLRKEYLKLSQAEFGDKLGVSRSVINNIERNVLARPDQKLSLIKLMCKEFNVNEEWLREGTGDMFESINLDFGKICLKIGTSDPKAKAAIMKYYELSLEDKELFWKFMERFMK